MVYDTPKLPKTPPKGQSSGKYRSGVLGEQRAQAATSAPRRDLHANYSHNNYRRNMRAWYSETRMIINLHDLSSSG
jgi:hypothetical protein